MEELQIGQKVNNRYQLKEYKGSGSFGEVWLAYDEYLNIDVAIKIYISLDNRGLEEFKTEYKNAYGLTHPYLLAAMHFDVWEQRPFLVMKYCPNGSAGSIIGKASEQKIWKFIHDVAAGLHFLHTQKPDPIVHQDIKPDNVLIDEQGDFLITDFGISKKIRATMRKQSKRDATAGAAAYMGPERFSKDPMPMTESDVWSLGASIHELATGELPFCGMGGGLLNNGAEMPELGGKWSENLNFVMQSCLAKETKERPDAQQLADYAEAMLQSGKPECIWRKNGTTGKNGITGKPVTTENSVTTEKPGRKKSKRTTAWASIALLLILIAAWGLLHIRKTDSAATDTKAISAREHYMKEAETAWSTAQSCMGAAEGNIDENIANIYWNALSNLQAVDSIDNAHAGEPGWEAENIGKYDIPGIRNNLWQYYQIQCTRLQHEGNKGIIFHFYKEKIDRLESMKFHFETSPKQN